MESDETSWSPDTQHGTFVHPLEELKYNKTRRFELRDIVGHVGEMSMDQHGSRFIQQRLETAPEEERELVFVEVMPQALTLMTDVFGNYVIQKFFEHGTPAQRRSLAGLLQGHVLALSLQVRAAPNNRHKFELFRRSVSLRHLLVGGSTRHHSVAIKTQWERCGHLCSRRGKEKKNGCE